ncbi:MAG TPA: hypothetical protein DEB40_02700 [Elusimicrobia bacterium]|nr:hypothetical protein [Elusimicrobiota bacterium]HBT60639.1 hypothetical protein [Elusimicrobiota bacterium]
MLSASNLNELLNLRSPVSGIVSLYLPADTRRAYVRTFSNLLRLRCLEEPTFSAVAEDLRLLDEFVGRDFKPAGWRGLAVFSAKRLGLWRVCPLLEPVRAALRVAPQPFIAPLLSIADQYQRFGVVLADDQRARFLEVFMGQIREFEDLVMEAPRLESAQGRAVAQRLDGLVRNHAFARIVIGACPSTAIRLSAHLRTELQQSLIFDENLSPKNSAIAVLSRIQACESEARKVRETVLAHRLVDLALANGPAVLGLERTLRALRQGAVRLLLVRDGFAKMGHLCPRCGELSLAFSRCPACGNATQALFDVVEEMIQRALDGHCEVLRLLNPTPLDNMGHIGAELSGNIVAAPASQPAPQREG